MKPSDPVFYSRLEVDDEEMLLILKLNRMGLSLKSILREYLESIQSDRTKTLFYLTLVPDGKLKEVIPFLEKLLEEKN